MQEKTRLVMLTEHSPFMMGFVYLTKEGRAVVIDGGSAEDMPWLFEIVGNRQIAAWILTHPHMDHVSGFADVVEKGERLPQIEKVYYNFPSPEFVERCEGDEDGGSRAFARVEDRIRDRAVIVEPGLQLDVDELHFDFLFCGGERYAEYRPNLGVNESSLVVRVTSPGLRSALFLADLGPAGGRDLLKNCGDKLPSDIVQMAHHGHSGVTKAVYEKIAPKACLWCAPEWLWEEADEEFEPELWGTRHQRKWMDELGVKEHYVTKDGTQDIPLEK